MHKLLFVEDSQLLLRTTTAFLAMHEFDIITAENGIDAFEKTQKIDGLKIIVTDIEMPEMDGIELIQKVRAGDRYPRIPIIVRTSAKEKLQAAIKAGATGWVLKQSTDESDELLKTINKLI